MRCFGIPLTKEAVNVNFFIFDSYTIDFFIFLVILLKFFLKSKNLFFYDVTSNLCKFL